MASGYQYRSVQTGASQAIVHACLLVFVLIPVVPLLAAQINYDNLFLPLMGLVLLMAVNFSNELRRHKRVNGPLLLQIGILCLLTSLVKYAFLPAFTAIIIYLTARLWRTLKGPHGIWLAFKAGMKRVERLKLAMLIVALLLSGGLFAERYGVNMVRYHTPLPDCGQVLSVQSCRSYPPWARDYDFSLYKTNPSTDPVVFMSEWLYGMWLRLFFAVDGPATDFETRGPLLVPAFSAIGFAAVSSLVVLVYLRRIFRIYKGEVLGLLTLVAVLYIGVLWLNGFQAYIRTGQPVALNGRYLFPVLPPLLLVAGLAFNEMFKRRTELKLLVACVAVLSLLWGGGALTYILRSRDIWYWPSPTVRAANHALQNTLGPVTPGYRNPIEFLH
jgi:hypothetical protein